MALAHADLTDKIIGAAITVHRELGPGLLESACEECLCCEFSHGGLAFQRQVDLPVMYRGIRLNCGYVIDLIVENLILLELKAVDEIHPVHQAQLLTYLKLGKLSVGLLMNSNVPVLKQGITRHIL